MYSHKLFANLLKKHHSLCLQSIYPCSKVCANCSFHGKWFELRGISYLFSALVSEGTVVEMSVTNNSLSKDYPHLDNHTKHFISSHSLT